MRRLTLREYRRTDAVELTPAQRDLLSSAAGVDVRPTLGRSGYYDLTPGSTVGTLALDGMQIDLRPKIELDRVLFLISYALDPVRWRDQQVQLDERDTVVEAMVQLFVAASLAALRRGPLQGYQRREEALPTVRGRIRVADQVRDRYGLVPPVEVAYDEFTIDIEENRRLKAAALRVARLPIANPGLRRRLGAVVAHLEDVPAVGYDPRRLSDFSFTRLNRHYRSALELANLVLQSSSLELDTAEHSGSAFLVDMNAVFETFLLVALREATPGQLIAHERRLHLDTGRRIVLKPDLTWLDQGRVSFVGDAKYKTVVGGDGRNPDLYQLLAYVIALDLPAGMLVHAAGEGEPGRHEVVNLGRELHVEWLDVSGTPEQILASVAALAGRIRSLATPPAPPIDTDDMRDRIAGTLLGMASGDALGAGYEFQHPPFDTIDMIGGGLGDFAPGEWTDDTSMAVCIAEVLAAGPLDLEAIASRFLTWARSDPPDIGISTRAVLDRVQHPAQAVEVAAQYFADNPHGAAGNGALMRTAPVALAHLGDDGAIAAVARSIAELTHADPLAGDSCVLWCIGLDRAIRERRLDGIRDGLTLVPAERRAEWAAALDAAEQQPLATFVANGFTVTALQAAYAAIRQTPIPAARPDQHLVHALEAAIRIGNDTDTVAAIAGSLLGAYWGASAVPTRWRKMLHGWPGLRAADLANMAEQIAGRST